MVPHNVCSYFFLLALILSFYGFYFFIFNQKYSFRNFRRVLQTNKQSYQLIQLQCLVFPGIWTAEEYSDFYHILISIPNKENHMRDHQIIEVNKRSSRILAGLLILWNPLYSSDRPALYFNFSVKKEIDFYCHVVMPFKAILKQKLFLIEKKAPKWNKRRNRTKERRKMVLHYMAILVSSLSKEMLNFSVLMDIEWLK